MNFIEKAKELKAAQPAAPKLSKAKAAAAAKALAETNPNRARIEAKLAALKAALKK